MINSNRWISPRIGAWTNVAVTLAFALIAAYAAFGPNPPSIHYTPWNDPVRAGHVAQVVVVATTWVTALVACSLAYVWDLRAKLDRSIGRTVWSTLLSNSMIPLALLIALPLAIGLAGVIIALYLSIPTLCLLIIIYWIGAALAPRFLIYFRVWAVFGSAMVGLLFLVGLSFCMFCS